MEFVRMFLVLAHLGALGVAAVSIAFGDHALLGRRRLDGRMLQRASHGVAWALAALWLSGVGLIAVDTGFDPAEVLGRPKVLAKLTVVLLLTLNGLYLHRAILPGLISPRPASRRRHLSLARRATRAGAASAACWGFGAFLGVARPLAPVLGYTGFMVLFVAVLVVAGVLAWRWVFPVLARRLQEAAGNVMPPHAPAQPASDRPTPLVA